MFLATDAATTSLLLMLLLLHYWQLISLGVVLILMIPLLLGDMWRWEKIWMTSKVRLAILLSLLLLHYWHLISLEMVLIITITLLLGDMMRLEMMRRESIASDEKWLEDLAKKQIDEAKSRRD